jgi:hypothetical protein
MLPYFVASDKGSHRIADYKSELMPRKATPGVSRNSKHNHANWDTAV